MLPWRSLLSLLQVLHMLTCILAVTVGPQSHQKANCSLNLVGLGHERNDSRSDRPPVLSLHCVTADGQPLKVGVNTAWINETNSDLSGVLVVSTPCKSRIEGQGSALLWFCGCDVHFHQLAVAVVQWQGSPAVIMGSLLCFGDHARVTVLRGVFVGTKLVGPVINVISAHLTVTDSTFTDNRKSTAPTANAMATICAEHSSLVLNNSRFQENGLLLDGGEESLGAVMWGGAVTAMSSHVIVSGCNFVHNQVVGFGGALSAFQSDVLIKDSSFFNNRAAGLGGACFFGSCNASIRNSSFVRNSAVQVQLTMQPFGSSGGTGAQEVQMQQYALDVTSVDGQGGAIWAGVGDVDTLFKIVDGQSACSLHNCSFEQNKAERYGGAVFFFGPNQPSKLVAADCKFTENLVHVIRGSSPKYLALRSPESSAQVNSVSTHAQYGGGAVSAFGNEVSFDQCVFDSNTAQGDIHGGAVLLRGANAIEAKKPTTYGNGMDVSCMDDGSSGSCDIGAMLSIMFATFRHSTFYNNSVDGFGGALWSQAANITLLKSNFSNNMAYSTKGVAGGGAMATYNASLRLLENIATGNTADTPTSSGGVMWIDGGSKVVATDCVFWNNTGANSNFSSGGVFYAVRASVIALSSCKALENKAAYGGVAYASSTSRVVITNSSILANNTAYMGGGAIWAVGSALVRISGNTSCINNIDLNSCHLGQIRQDGGCQMCPRGSYSVAQNSSACLPCPAGANCTGGAVLLLEPGYWRSSTLSDQIHRCPNFAACIGSQQSNQPQSLHLANNQQLPGCLGGQDTGASSSNGNANALCASGYHGNLCGQCMPGYGAVKPFSCRQCLNRGAIVALFALGAVVLLVFIKVVCHFTVKEAFTANTSILDNGHHHLEDGVQATDLLKPLVLYLQYILIVASSNIQWPEVFSYHLKVMAAAFSTASPETLSADCFFSRNGLPLGIKKTLLYLLAPVVMLIALLAFEAVLHMLPILRRKATNLTAVTDLVDRLASTAIVVLFFFLPSLLRTAFNLFACIEIDKVHASISDIGLKAEGRFWLVDVSQPCFEAWHKSWSLGLGIPMVLVCMSLPLMVMLLTIRNQERSRSDASFSRHYGFLYRNYRQSCCYWEGVVGLQTIALVAVLVFGYTLGAYFQNLLLLFVLMLILVMLVAMKPYARPVAQRLMELGMACVLLTTFVGLTLVPDGYVQDASTSTVYKLAMGMILVAMNASFVFYAVWRLLYVIPWPLMLEKVLALVAKGWASFVTCMRAIAKWCGVHVCAYSVN